MSHKLKDADWCVRRKHHSRWRYATVFVVVLVGSTLSVALLAALRSNEHSFARRQFEQSSQDHISALQRTLDTAVLILKSLRSLCISTNEISGKAFSALAAPLVEDHPSIQAVQWAPRTGSSQGQECFPILLSQPRNAGAGAVGKDLAANPACREAIRRACEFGRPVLTERTPLYAKPGNRNEVRLLLPVFEKQAVLDSAENRRKHLQGFVVGVLSPKEIVEQGLVAADAGGDRYLAGRQHGSSQPVHTLLP